MNTRKETVDVINDLIAAWVINMEITAVVDNGNGTYTVSVPKTYYLKPGKYRKLTINSVVYEVTAVVNNSSVTLKGASAPAVGTVVLPPPYFFNGTIIQTNNELTKIKALIDKTPMIYLRRPFNETLDAEDLNDTDIATKADVTLCFLTEAQFAAWETADHDKYAIKPMRNLMYAFIEYLKSSTNAKKVERLTDYEVSDLIRFGVVTSNGVEKSLFSDNYSGVQMNITLELKYQCVCC